MASFCYSDHPRYTPGSPAAFFRDFTEAKHIADEERASFLRYKEGVFGEENRLKAERLGLRGIVELHKVLGDRIEVEDEITGERSVITTHPIKGVLCPTRDCDSTAFRHLEEYRGHECRRCGASFIADCNKPKYHPTPKGGL